MPLLNPPFLLLSLSLTPPLFPSLPFSSYYPIMTNAIDTIRRYFSAGNNVFIASSLPTINSHLSKRSIVHLQKRIDWCTSTTYCANGSHCIGGGLCEQDFNWYWILVFGVFLDIFIIYICIRRRRATAAMASQPAVVPQMQYLAYPPPQNFASTAGNPNMAYQTPAAYVPLAGGPTPIGYTIPNSMAMTTPTIPTIAYSAPYTPSSTREPQLVDNAATAPYLVPQDEESFYATPSAGEPQLVDNAATVPYLVPQSEDTSYTLPK
ncbi:MAG: hypothetical protein J3R72DRAFT_530569 [Linnemannia gamsii]|nr:MAG: hypothetical protein J3R72DRAFT_530569 [Linnemannia gamsii]